MLTYGDFMEAFVLPPECHTHCSSFLSIYQRLSFDIYTLDSLSVCVCLCVCVQMIWFGLVSVLRPFDTFKVISGAVSYPNHTVRGQASSKAVYQYLVCILSPVTDNCSS